MRTTRIIWASEALVSLSLLALIYSRLSGGEAHTFLKAEVVLVLFTFLLALFVGGPGKILAAGAGLGVGLASAFAIAVSASGSCSEADLICFSPGDMFAIGMVLACALYPGWALGTGLGTLARMTSFAVRSNR